jgi:iron complex transport system substrate-binding protein
MAGRPVELPASVDSVIGLGSGGLRLLTYVGATGDVVGVEQLETTSEKRPFRPYVHANPSLSDRPSIGSRKSPDAELLLQQDPDVIVWAWAKGGDATNLQNRLGIPVVVIRPGDIDPTNRSDFFRSLELLGTVTGRREAASELTSYTRSLVDDLQSRTGDVPAPERPSSYVGYLGRGKHGFPYTQPLYPPFDFVNADNVAGGVSEDLKKKKGAARVTVDPEKIIEWDPSYVFVDVGTESYDALTLPEYESITAIENGDVYAVFPTRDYSINFGTALADAYYVGSVLYPDRFGDVDPVAKADEIYETFVGAPVYDDVAESYGTGFGRMEL